jgi:hypothetical protein
MSLPKQTLPIFTLTVPSTKKKVSFRQFTVREEKMLAQAQQSEEISVIANAAKEVIRACVMGVKPEELALFDIEYIMTKIRAKSVGEKIELSLACEKDPKHKATPYIVDLDKIEVVFHPGHTKNIELYGGTGVIMKYPSIDSIVLFEDMDGLEAIAECIESVYTPEEVFYIKDQTRKEVIDFLESLTKEQVDKIEDLFFRKMPVYEYVMEYNCIECGHKHKKTVKGLSNFFV